MPVLTTSALSLEPEELNVSSLFRIGPILLQNWLEAVGEP